MKINFILEIANKNSKKKPSKLRQNLIEFD